MLVTLAYMCNADSAQVFACLCALTKVEFIARDAPTQRSTENENLFRAINSV